MTNAIVEFEPSEFEHSKFSKLFTHNKALVLSKLAGIMLILTLVQSMLKSKK